MIKTNNLDEYVALNVLKNTCENCDCCDNCPMRIPCAGINILFKKLEIVYEPEVSGKEDVQEEVDKWKHEYFSECDLREKLDQALDKACEQLSHKDTITKERWKEILLNDDK